MSDEEEYGSKVNDDFKNTIESEKDVVFGFSYFLGVKPIVDVSWSQIYC